MKKIVPTILVGLCLGAAAFAADTTKTTTATTANDAAQCTAMDNSKHGCMMGGAMMMSSGNCPMMASHANTTCPAPRTGTTP